MVAMWDAHWVESSADWRAETRAGWKARTRVELRGMKMAAWTGPLKDTRWAAMWAGKMVRLLVVLRAEKMDTDWAALMVPWTAESKDGPTVAVMVYLRAVRWADLRAILSAAD